MFLKKYNNSIAIVIKLIKHLKLRITDRTIADALELHPDYPTLLSISDVLGQFGIENRAISNITIGQLHHIPCPFITHSEDRQFMLATRIDETSIEINDRIISLDEFSKNFDGVILAVESLPDAGDRNYAENKHRQFLDSLRNPAIIAGLLVATLLILLFHSAYFYNFNWQIALITLFKGLGMAVSILLLIQSIDANNPLIQKLCQNDTHKNCNAILSSKAAKVFNGLTWSEVGFFYFTGTFFAFLFNNSSIAILQALAIFNILCLPYTFYSIYYQTIVAKQWCILCCIIQTLLWLEFFPLVINLNKSFTFPDIAALSDLFICFIIPFTAWIWIKPFLVKSQKITPLNQQLNKFKYNTDLFNKLLTGQVKYSTPDEKWSVVLGNLDNPDMIITMVSNPYCGPCIGAHKILDELLYTKSNIQVRFVFVFNNINSEDDKRMVVARQLLAMDATGDKVKLKKAMNDWYEQKQRNFPEWAKKYPAVYNGEVTNQLEKQARWRSVAEIKATPTILINGYKLPYPYQLDDLKYF